MSGVEVKEYGDVYQEGHLNLPPGLSYEEWYKHGVTLSVMYRNNYWWIGDWLQYGEFNYAEKYAQATTLFGYEIQTLNGMQWVASRFESMRRRILLPWWAHRVLAALEPEVQDQCLDWFETLPEEERQRAALRAYVRDIKRLTSGSPKANTYRVLYADPPWKYSDELIDGYGAAVHHYPPLSIQELVDLELAPGKSVKEWVQPDAVLFLWVTSPFIQDVFQIVEAWGFKYKTSFVWDKVKHNYGHYNSVRHELLLVCTRGSCTPDADILYDSVVTIERTDKHSEKPEEFRNIIDALYPDGSALELFSREWSPPEGSRWQTWGLEAVA